MSKESPQKTEIAIDQMWQSSLVPPVQQYEEFIRFRLKNARLIKREQKPLLNLTEVMLLRMLNRHTEAEYIIAKRRLQFNGIKHKIYAHRWKRMQVVEQMRLGDTTTTALKAKTLADEAAANNWKEEELRALFLLHLIEMHAGHFTNALNTAQQVKVLAQKSGNDYYILQCAWAVAHVYFFFGHYSKALAACLKVRKQFYENDLSKPQHLTYFNLLANCYQMQNKLDPAIEIYERILDYLKTSEAGDTLLYIAAASNMASALVKKGQIKGAEDTYKDISVYAQKTGWPIHRLDSNLNLARLYLKQKRLKEMNTALTEAEKVALEVDTLRLTVSVLELRLEYEKAVGKADEIVKVYESYFQKYREWQAVETSEKLKAIEMKHELEVQRLNEEAMKKELLLQEQEVQILNSHLQQKNKLITQFADYFTQLEETNIRRKEIFVRLREMVQTIKTTQQTEKGNYSTKFNQTHRQLSDKLIDLCSSVTAKEADTAVMLIQGLGNKEIATLTLTTPRNIEKHRLSLRRKLKVGKGDDLVRKLRQLLL